MKLILIRHGETQYNKDGIRQGHLDIDLDEDGVEQAKAAAVKLKNSHFDLVFSSDLVRATHTAQIILSELNSDIAAITNKKLRELNLGQWQGQPRSKSPFKELGFNEKAGVTGETLKEMYERVQEIINKMFKNMPDMTVLIVSHRGPVNAILDMVGHDHDISSKIPNAVPIEVRVTKELQIPVR